MLVRSEMFTEEVMVRMPRGTQNTFIEADRFCQLRLAALERGETSVVIPRRLGFVPRLKNLFPTTIEGLMARTRLTVLDDVID